MEMHMCLDVSVWVKWYVNANSKAMFEYERSWDALASNGHSKSHDTLTHREWERNINTKYRNSIIIIIITASTLPPYHYRHQQITTASPQQRRRHCRFKPTMKHSSKSRPIFRKNIEYVRSVCRPPSLHIPFVMRMQCLQQ